MKHFRTFVYGLAFFQLAGCASNQASPKPLDAPNVAVKIHAAGSLREALTRITRNYQARTGQTFELTFGASGLLREGLEKGAQADIFASADVDHPTRLAASGHWSSPTVFVKNALCALTSAQVLASSANLLPTMLQADIRVGTSTPKSDPSGDYTWALFRKADGLVTGAYATLDRKALKLTGAADSPQAPKGRSFYAWAMDEGQADVFVTYCTNTVAAQVEVPRLKVVQFPASLQVQAAYGLTVKKSASTDAVAFAAAIREADAQNVFRALGFTSP